MSELVSAMNHYIDSPRDADANFTLGWEYQRNKQYAAAISFHLRCAELSKSPEQVYESLLLSWQCINAIGGRPKFERGQLLTAIAQSPQRPEAYYLLCHWYELHGVKTRLSIEEMHSMIYTHACIGEKNLPGARPFSRFDGYPGDYGLLFYKGFSGWHLGHVKQSEALMLDLWNNHPLNDAFKQYVRNNLDQLGLSD